MKDTMTTQQIIQDDYEVGATYDVHPNTKQTKRLRIERRLSANTWHATNVQTRRDYTLWTGTPAIRVH